MITIIDYGVGNLKAFMNIYDKLGIDFRVAKQKGDLENASKIILPGVGAFDYTISKLNESGLRETLDHLVLNEKVPVLGICVGMQLMAAKSDEGILPGLNWVPGTVRKFQPSENKLYSQLPHMGWNQISPTNHNSLFRGIEDAAEFYFLHSYYYECNNAEDIAASTDYGIHFSSAVQKGNVFGVQFHPEKSHQNGVKLLENFATL